MKRATLWAAAGAQVAAARSDRMPTLDLAAAYSTNLRKPVMFLPPDMAEAFGGLTTLETGGDYELAGALTARVKLWTAGRLSSSQGAARGYLDAARLRELAVRDYVQFAASAAYFDVLLAQAELANAELALAETAKATRLARLGLAQASRGPVVQIGGVLVSSVFTLYVVPVVYVLFDRLTLAGRRERAARRSVQAV